MSLFGILYHSLVVALAITAGDAHANSAVINEVVDVEHVRRLLHICNGAISSSILSSHTIGTCNNNNICNNNNNNNIDICTTPFDKNKGAKQVKQYTGY